MASLVSACAVRRKSISGNTDGNMRLLRAVSTFIISAMHYYEFTNLDELYAKSVAYRGACIINSFLSHL